jgi:tetratricopeptide (TPR) repeat protein
VGRIEEAIEAFQEALRQKPDYLKARENLEWTVYAMNHMNHPIQ